MLIKSKTSFSGSKAKRTLLYLIIVSITMLFCNTGLFAATLSSIKADANKLILDTNGLEKVRLAGNDTNNVIIILPDTKLQNIYGFQSTELTRTIQKNVPGITSIEVVQYALDPPEARIIVKATRNIKPDITQNDKNNQVVIHFETGKPPISNLINQSKPKLRDKINYYNLPNFKFSENNDQIDSIVSLKVNGDEESAIRELESLYNNTRNPWAGYKLSLYNVNKGHLETASKINEEILSKNKDFFASHYALGIINDIKGDTDKAIQHYKQACSIYPEYQNARYRLGLAYMKNENYAAAEKEFLRTLDIYPEHAGALQNMGLLLLKLSRVDEAKDYFKLSLRTDALNNLGNIFLRDNDTSDALKFFAFAIKLEPQNPILNYNLARSYQLLEEKEKALHYYEKAISLKPDMYNAYYNIAIIHTQLGNSERAINSFYEYLKLNPEALDSGQVNTYISQLKENKDD
jgi:tetratricopeptide (TPR) repeat protein